MVRLLVNLALFVVIFFPGAALMELAQEALRGDIATSEPGTNFILWLIYTTPWLIPCLAAVPIVHFAASVAARRSTRRGRQVAMLLAPLLCCGISLILWGEAFGFSVRLALPAIAFGAAVRLRS